MAVMFLFAGSVSVGAQNVSFNNERLTLKQAFEKIEAVSKYKIAYNASQLDVNKQVVLNQKNKSIPQVVEELLSGSGYTCEVKGNQIVVVPRKAGTAASDKIVVKGKVTDENGDGVIGASVMEKGTSNGVVTDVDGNFSLQVESASTLVVSYIGYTTREVAVGNRTSIEISLAEDQTLIDEVVVIGYGVQKKSSMTASVSTVSAKEISKQVTSNVASALLGRTPGVEILQAGGEAGGDVSILVRGAASFGSTEPLYIIDGAVSNNGINSLNSADIESIEILKDGSAAAIYGSRAANGVVLVTTKSGKAGKTKVEVNSSYSYQTPSKQLDFMNASQWRQFANMMADNSANYSHASQNDNPSDPNYSQDWQDLYYRNASMWNLGAGISGGSENATFNTSIGFTDQKGIIIQSDYKKYNARVNSTFKKGRLSVQENLSLAHTHKTNAPRQRTIEIPTIPVKDSFGRYVSTPSELGYSFTNADISNPLARMYVQDDWVKKTDITGSLGATLDLGFGFKYKLNLAGSYLSAHNYTHTPEFASYWTASGDMDSRFSQPYTSLDEGRDESFNYTIDNLLFFNNTFGGHTFDVLLGTSWMREYYRSMGINSGVNDLGSASITTYNGNGTVESNELNSALLSFFARLNYDYMNRYLLSLSIRSDKSSKFADGHRVGYFPSVSAGWNIHEEKFFNIPWIYRLKLRASYGELGANFINPYQFTNLAYGPVPTIFNDKRQFGYVTRLMQQTLTWEKAISSNVGLELGLFNNALTFTAEYFWRRNNDLLAPLESLPSSGQTIVINDGELNYYNTASVENKGFEFTLGYNKNWGDWSLNAQGNITFLKNKVRKLGEGVQPIRGNLVSSKYNDRATLTKEGLPIGSFYGYKVVGVSQTTGNFLFEGADGTAKESTDVSEDDKQVIGDPNPDFTFGLNVNLGYRNWDLTAFFQGTAGNDIYAAAKYQYIFNPDTNKLIEALGAWTPSNKSNTLCYANVDNFAGSNSLPSSYYIQDGSYIRLKNLQLGYTFDKKVLNSIGFLESLRIYASVQNLFTITSYDLYDPEVSSNTLFDRGVDGYYQNSPAINARTYNIGFNVIF